MGATRCYAREGVAHAWLVDPLARTLEVLRREASRWLIVGAFADDAGVRAEPFEAIEIGLGGLWADVQGVRATVAEPTGA